MGIGGEWRVCGYGYGILSFWGYGNGYTAPNKVKATELHSCKWVDFIVCELYLDNAIKMVN